MNLCLPLNNSKSIGLESFSAIVFIVIMFGLLDIVINAAPVRGETDDGKFIGVVMPRYVSDG